ncbi:hypothetical protein DXG01_000582 [Tephrocybe rancida]|nr:hypothetical protein DXG01_000582 [Tephrocybe rancida]
MSSLSKFYKEPEFETLQLHAGQDVDPATNARAVPIHASVGFGFNDSAGVFEQRIAALEGGAAAVATSSGQSAQFLAILAIAESGDNIVSASMLFGGPTAALVIFKRFGLRVKFVVSRDPKDFVGAIDDNTKAIFVETIANSNSTLADVAGLAQVAHDHKIPLIVDNTFGMGGYLIKPIALGADIVGKFNWKTSGKFPGLTEPSEGHHGLVFADTFGGLAYAVKVRTELLRDLGPALDPFAAFLLLQGLETLSLRAERHSQNALALAKFLEKHPGVSWVSYLGLPTDLSHGLALRTLRSGQFGGVLNFGIKGDLAAANKVVESLRLASHLANLGDAKTLVIQASTAQQQLSAEEQLENGIAPDLIRVSVGIEAISDIIADFDNALNIGVVGS